MPKSGQTLCNKIFATNSYKILFVAKTIKADNGYIDTITIYKGANPQYIINSVKAVE